MRHIKVDKKMTEWHPPKSKFIVASACNEGQVIIALNGGELVYFELDQLGNLNEYQERKKMTSDVCCLSIAQVPEGRLRNRFLVCAKDGSLI